MRLIRVNNLQDVEHGGHHLDADLQHDLSRFGDNPHQKPLEVLQRLIIGAPAGFELVVAVAISALTEDASFHFGDNDYSKAKRGMWVMGSNHVMLWLRDAENRGRYQLGSMFHGRLMEVAKQCEPRNSGPMLSFVNHTVGKAIIAQQEEITKKIGDTTSQLTQLHEDSRLMFEQYRNVAHV